MNTRTLSVIIPARNAARTISALLDAVLELSMPTGWDKEIIVGYTESSDETLQLIRDRPVKCAINDTIGPAAARNAAAKFATGELLYFIDADACPIGSVFFVRLIDSASRRAQAGELGGFGGPILLAPAQD